MTATNMSGAQPNGGMEKKVIRAEKATPAGQGMLFQRMGFIKQEYLLGRAPISWTTRRG